MRRLTDFEERRLDQLAFEAEDAEDAYKKRRPGLPQQERDALKEQMEASQKHLEDFVQGIVK